jgi:hypothetical protein
MTTFRILAATLMFALGAPALASGPDVPMAASKAQFHALKAKLASQLETDKYGEIKPDDKRTVLNALERIAWRYEGIANPEQMSEQDRVDMFNDQEIINTIITHAAADSRLICERTAPTGSHLVRVTCMTLAKRKERERMGQESMPHNENNTFPGAESMKPGSTR